MFITIGTIAQHISDPAGEALLVSGVGRKSTAAEAAECINRYTMCGNPQMHKANKEFDDIYGHAGEIADALTESGLKAAVI